MPAPRRWPSARRTISGNRGGACGAARHRPLHGGGDRGDRVRRSAPRRSTAMSSGWWRGCSRSRTNCRPPSPRIRALAAGARSRRAVRRLRAGADGSRRHHLHAEEAGLRALSVDGAVRGARARRCRKLPAQGAEARGRLRRGAAFVVRRADGFVLVRTRPPKGLLGGMTEVPTTRMDARLRCGRCAGGGAALARATLKPKWRRCRAS